VNTIGINLGGGGDPESISGGAWNARVAIRTSLKTYGHYPSVQLGLPMGDEPVVSERGLGGGNHRCSEFSKPSFVVEFGYDSTQASKNAWPIFGMPHATWVTSLSKTYGSNDFLDVNAYV